MTEQRRKKKKNYLTPVACSHVVWAALYTSRRPCCHNMGTRHRKQNGGSSKLDEWKVELPPMRLLLPLMSQSIHFNLIKISADLWAMQGNAGERGEGKGVRGGYSRECAKWKRNKRKSIGAVWNCPRRTLPYPFFIEPSSCWRLEGYDLLKYSWENRLLWFSTHSEEPNTHVFSHFSFSMHQSKKTLNRYLQRSIYKSECCFFIKAQI